MLGHKWEAAQGVIVEARTGPPAGRGLSAALHPAHEYVIEVRKPTGDVVRGTVIEKSMVPRQVGETASVEVHSKTNEMRMDPNAPRMTSIRDMMTMTQQGPGAAGPGAALGGMPGLAGLASALGAAHTGGASIHVRGPGGQEIPVNMQSEEIRNLAQAMMSGDPAAKQAAIERIRQIKAEVQQQAAAGMRTGEPAGFGDAGAPGESAGFGSGSGFGQPLSPDPYRPVSPPSQSTFGSFDTGAGQGTKEERLTRLRQLLDKGILTESEYEAQRQQVLNGF